MPSFPEDSIQNMTDVWWEEDQTKQICRGTLIWTYVQFFSQVPYELTAERIEAENHGSAILKARPLHAGGRRSDAPSLPVAGLPRLDGADCFIANRAKKRPCLVLGAVDQQAIERSLTHGMAKGATHEFFLVAPYFSVGQQGRSGYNPPFVRRVMHAAFSRFFWDLLPGGQGHESILRFDQVQPVGFHYQAYEHFGYRLSREALCLIDEWMDWLIYGRDGDNLHAFRDLVQMAGEAE